MTLLTSQHSNIRKGQPPPRGIVRFTIPGYTPPSVNHYKKPVKYKTREGILRQGFAVTPEGLAFKQALAIYARGESISPATKAERERVRYALYVKVYLGKGERGDGDNFFKCVADGLQDAGVIHSDARVQRWRLEVEDCDRKNPRTEIRVCVIRGSL